MPGAYVHYSYYDNDCFDDWRLMIEDVCHRQLLEFMMMTIVVKFYVMLMLLLVMMLIIRFYCNLGELSTNYS